MTSHRILLSIVSGIDRLLLNNMKENKCRNEAEEYCIMNEPDVRESHSAQGSLVDRLRITKNTRLRFA